MSTTCDHPPACPPTCTHCLAYDRHIRSLCSRAPATAGSKWCAEHEMIQAKSLKSYKRLTMALEAFDESLLPPSDLDSLDSVEDLTLLQSWCLAARTKWSLIQRVISAREEHHAQFYAGGDEGHKGFVGGLRVELGRLERLMRGLDRRAYAVTLARSSASWVLAPSTSPNIICHEEEEETPSTTISPLTPPSTPPSSSFSKKQRNQRKKREARRASLTLSSSSSSSEENTNTTPSNSSSDDPSFLLQQLRQYLLPPPNLLPASTIVRPSTWHQFISGLFRYTILRIPELGRLALEFDDSDAEGRGGGVEGFLNFLEEGLQEERVRKLWRGMKFRSASSVMVVQGDDEEEEGPQLGVGILGQVVKDLFCRRREEEEEEEEGVYVQVLGGRVYKDDVRREREELPTEAWALLYQFIPCPGCLLPLLPTYSSLALVRRLALLGSFPSWLPSSSESAAEQVLRLAGAQVLADNREKGRVGSRVRREGKGGRRGSKVLVEEWERAWVYWRLNLNQPSAASSEWTRRILSTLSSLPSQFTLLARDGATHQLLYSPSTTSECTRPGCTCDSREGMWLTRLRSGITPEQRKSANWTTVTFFPTTSALSSFSSTTSPEIRFRPNRTCYSDTTEILLLDARAYSPSTSSSSSSNSWRSFLDSLARVVLRTNPWGSQCENLEELIREQREEAVEKGETPVGQCQDDETDEGDGKVAEENWRARSMFREDF